MANSKTTTIWIVIVIVVLAALGGWWYFSMQNTSVTTTTTQTQSSEKSIASFVLPSLSPEVNGAIDNTNYTVGLTVPAGTDVTTLTPTITVSDNATVTPSSGTAQDFTNPVSYTVTAQDGSTQNYTVTVTVAAAAAATPQ